MWRDVLIALILAALAFFASLEGARRVGPTVVHQAQFNVWFDADIPRVFANMSDRHSIHIRTKVHPLFSLATWPVVRAIQFVTSMGPLAAVNVYIALVGSLWIALMFILLRLIGCRRPEAVLFTLLTAVSAFAMFWFVVPETFSVASLSLLPALVVVAAAWYRRISPAWYVVSSALTLSITLTNWMTGVFAAFASFSWRRAAQITITAFSVVVVLWGVEKFVFPTAAFFIGDREERRYILRAESGGPIRVISSFLFHSVVMPVFRETQREDWVLMTTQYSFPGSGTPWGMVGVILWLALLVLGLWGFFRAKQHPQLRIVLGVTLIGQLVLHVLYGAQTFTYSAHFGPLLILVAAFSMLTRARPVALVLAGALTIVAAINNGMQFDRSVKFVQAHITERFVVRRAIEERPADPWPRDVGHAILANPGTGEDAKAYHEPGGSFSPSAGSFGVSVWITDGQGAPLVTSDTIPLNQVHQELSWPDGTGVPGILSKTSNYQTEWANAGPGRWVLHFRPFALVNTSPAVLVRSVGPAGGPVRSLHWDGRRLLINERWTVTLDPPPVAVHVGREGPDGWKSARSNQSRWSGHDGWGYARFELSYGAASRLLIEDTPTRAIAQRKFTDPRPSWVLNLPDDRFASSLNAQVAHLMMGLVGRQTRPGDPMSYPLAWQREGAYVVAALARAGKLADARVLSIELAEQDFFGGFGPEADAPGLAIWALEEVAVRLGQREHDRWLWPHVQRKANLILEMLSANRPIRRQVPGLTVPDYARSDPEFTLVADRPRNGLIIGRVERRRPILYVNAVSYRGLLDAAALADRVNEPTYATLWRDRAGQLKRAWERAFRLPEANDDRTYVIWPTGIAGSDFPGLLRGLEARWARRRDADGGFLRPVWLTYLEVAEAHQWLVVGRPDRAWTTLNWFLDHQASPGLYTWWEGEPNWWHGSAKRPDPFRWQSVRGWVNPPHITPHYGTAAEMLLLQLEMLVSVDEAASEPTLVIGRGIPPAWVGQPMSVGNVLTRVGGVDWNWNGQEMAVRIRGCRCKVRLGSAFARGTPLRIEYVTR